MISAANGKLQKTRTAEDIKTDSEFDANEGQAPAKSQSTKTVIPVQTIGARNIMVKSFFYFRYACILTADRRLTGKFTLG